MWKWGPGFRAGIRLGQRRPFLLDPRRKIPASRQESPAPVKDAAAASPDAANIDQLKKDLNDWQSRLALLKMNQLRSSINEVDHFQEKRQELLKTIADLGKRNQDLHKQISDLKDGPQDERLGSRGLGD